MKMHVLILIFLLVILMDTNKNAAYAADNHLQIVDIIQSCEGYRSWSCVIKKSKKALTQPISLSKEDNLAIRYELAARYEYYGSDPQKALDMYREIEKISPDYGITRLCISRLESLIESAKAKQVTQSNMAYASFETIRCLPILL